jgi:hypothetical protein
MSAMVERYANASVPTDIVNLGPNVGPPVA